jgi:hypothetical protein
MTLVGPRRSQCGQDQFECDRDLGVVPRGFRHLPCSPQSSTVEGEGEGLRFTCRQGRGGCIWEQSKNTASMGAIVGQGWLSDDGLEDG